MIDIANLTKHFGPKVAVDNLSLSVQKGQVLGFLGPNGAGKSTTMRMITGYLPPTSGSIVIGGIDMLEDPNAAKARIGYLPESAPLYQDMTVEGFLSFAAELGVVGLLLLGLLAAAVLGGIRRAGRATWETAAIGAVGAAAIGLAFVEALPVPQLSVPLALVFAVLCARRRMSEARAPIASSGSSKSAQRGTPSTPASARKARGVLEFAQPAAGCCAATISPAVMPANQL